MSQTFTERVAGNRTGGDLMRWLVVGIAAVIVAAGLFALGRWTALAVEAVALVLREHDDLQVASVGEVRQREVDQTVRTAERHRRLGAVVREREQSLALATGEDDDENLRLSHAPRVLRPAPSTVRTTRGSRPPVDATTNRRPSRVAATSPDACGR